ncbi:divergent polysaccharide deacetylase family protein [Actinobacillus arthritidis]|uniref:divergent polysaccharide deacetylase family protein n=1 Tax=Actinobacillus arthritidis TaxID=157339 RepID=UPI00244156BB|nr:divergent polysaccharide deacetylase family protein [Actinobacillus arthritidis]WGE90104.1 divergent polysaccharide deacetylase family protein [Actinobacillus arthritidis]
MWNLLKHKRSIFSLFLQGLLILSPLAQAGKLAIVIDDIGYRAKEDSAIYALPKEVSVAIIPVAPHATQRAKMAYEQERDVLIHLPMRPQNKAQPIESEALLVGANEEKVKQLIESARNQVPYAIGLNNHMGSGATADRQTMQNLMRELAKQQLFFLDSKTGPSVATKVAREFGVNALERSLFLDDNDTLSEVQNQFHLALQYARKHGSAILIGHPRKNSIEVLQKGIVNLPKDIQLVGMKALWRNEAIIPDKPFIMIFDDMPAPTSISPFNDVPLLRGIPKD